MLYCSPSYNTHEPIFSRDTTSAWRFDLDFFSAMQTSRFLHLSNGLAIGLGRVLLCFVVHSTGPRCSSTVLAQIYAVI